MSTTDELSTREHDELRDLVLAGTQRIRPTGAHRAQFAAAGAALVLVGAITGGVITAALQSGDDPHPAVTPGPITPSVEDPQPTPVVRGTTFLYPNPNIGSPPSDYQAIEYAVPAEWEVGVTYVGKNLGQPNEVAVSFWTTAGVYPDPCHWRDTELSPLDLTNHGHPDGGAPIVSDPDTGLAAQHDRTPTALPPVLMPARNWSGGVWALPFELTVPADLDIASCDDGVYRAWPYSSPAQPGNDNHVAGQTDLVYEVDVDRSPLLIDASFRPGASPEDINELYAVLGSITIIR